MTAIRKSDGVSELREMFRFLLTFRTMYETCGTDEIVNSFGNLWSLWDLEYLYKQTSRLNIAQRRAITLCLVHGMLEREAAIAMGVSENNPVGMYASLGLRRLLDMLDDGELTRFRERSINPHALQAGRRTLVDDLAAFIRSKVLVDDGHWLFPTAPGRTPSVIVRSRSAPSGFRSLHPRDVLHEEAVGRPVGEDFRVAHTEPDVPTCVNPRHSIEVLTDAARARLRTRVRRASWSPA